MTDNMQSAKFANLIQQVSIQQIDRNIGLLSSNKGLGSMLENEFETW